MNPNFGMGVPMNMNMNMNMQGMPQGMNMNMAMMDNEEWLKGFQMGVDEVNALAQQESQNDGPKINVIFKTTQGTTTAMVYDYGTTIDKSLEKYLKRVGRPDLYQQKKDF